jgi:Leucine-rich repeat (LRR) protein
VKYSLLINLTKLSNALNDQKMPLLEELDVSQNRIQLETFQLNQKIPLKRLSLQHCELMNLSFLANILYQTPHLEELRLGGNDYLKLETFRVDFRLPQLVLFDLSACKLTDVSPLMDVLLNIPNLKVLDLSFNLHIQWNTFQLNAEIPLKHLNVDYCGLTETSLLAHVLDKMPELEVLDYKRDFNPRCVIN